MITIHHRENLAPNGNRVITLQVTEGLGDLAAASIVHAFNVRDCHVNKRRDGEVVSVSATCTFSDDERTVFVVEPYPNKRESGSIARALGEMVHPFAEAEELVFIPPLDDSPAAPA